MNSMNNGEKMGKENIIYKEAYQFVIKYCKSLSTFNEKVFVLINK
jgi:hypothetical protein